MLVIRQSNDEVELSASASELQAIRKQITVLLSSAEQSTHFPATHVNPAPYRQCLAGFNVRRTSGKTIVSVSGGYLVAEGCDDSLSRFSSWFNASPRGGVGSHVHFEPSVGDQWHSSESVALVVSAV